MTAFLDIYYLLQLCPADTGSVFMEGKHEKSINIGGSEMSALAGVQIRPPVEHVWGCGPLRPGEKPAEVKVFQHRLLQHFMLSIFCKLPVQPLRTNADLRRQFMVQPPPLQTEWCQLWHILLLKCNYTHFNKRLSKRHPNRRSCLKGVQHNPPCLFMKYARHIASTHSQSRQSPGRSAQQLPCNVCLLAVCNLLGNVTSVAHTFECGLKSQVRILLSVLTFRVNQRYVKADPPFIAIELDISDSSREGCAVSTLTITSEPKDWRGAVQVPSPPFHHKSPWGLIAEIATKQALEFG